MLAIVYVWRYDRGVVVRLSRRQQILDTAAALFARHGFHGVSIDDLGGALGVSGPALYRHFRAKDEILAQILLEVSRTLLAEGRRRVDDADDAHAALASLIAWHVEFALGQPEVITVHTRELDNLPGPARGQVRTLQRRYVAIWTDVIGEVNGDPDRARAEAAAHATFGLLNSTPHSARVPPAQMAPLLRQMAWAALTCLPAVRASA
jgi:AcrR family transcriptional regulator